MELCQRCRLRAPRLLLAHKQQRVGQTDALAMRCEVSDRRDCIAVQQALVVPVSVLRVAQQAQDPATLNDADWALYAVCHEYLGTPISTIPLQVKVAIAKAAHAPQPSALQYAVAQCLAALKRCLVVAAQRVHLKPGTQVLSADSKTTLMLGESDTRVTGKTITNFYR